MAYEHDLGTILWQAQTDRLLIWEDGASYSLPYGGGASYSLPYGGGVSYHWRIQLSSYVEWHISNPNHRVSNLNGDAKVDILIDERTITGDVDEDLDCYQIAVDPGGRGPVCTYNTSYRDLLLSSHWYNAYRKPVKL